jgi:hypothetical protein
MEFPPRPSDLPLIAARHTGAIRKGLRHWPRAADPPPALGDRRWPAELILSPGPGRDRAGGVGPHDGHLRRRLRPAGVPRAARE